MFVEKMLSIGFSLDECLIRVLGTPPHLSMARVLMMFPVMAVIVELVWVPAVFVCANIRAEVMDEMGSIDLCQLC